MRESFEEQEIYAHKKKLKYSIELSNKLTKLQNSQEFKDVFESYLYTDKFVEASKEWIRDNNTSSELTVKTITKLRILLEDILKEGENAKIELNNVIDFENSQL